MALHEQGGRRMRHSDEEAPTLKVPGQQAMREQQRRPARGASTGPYNKVERCCIQFARVVYMGRQILNTFCTVLWMLFIVYIVCALIYFACALPARLDPSYPTSVAFDGIPSEAFEGIPAVMTMGDGAGIPAATAAVGGGD
mmetsp:Transcript_72220/g.207290  ORF Transcript_72220/g.207290 Transcript_72220/m.207290 type:complete len:141 (-) Transcript_72220:104-526(-)